MYIKKTNTNHGITLIALIITIIIMLILVAVTITMAVNGGLFGQAASAGTQTNERVQEELEYVNVAGMTVQDLINKYTGKNEGVECNICLGTGEVSFYTCKNCTSEFTPSEAAVLWRALARCNSCGFGSTIKEGTYDEVVTEVASGFCQYKYSEECDTTPLRMVVKMCCPDCYSDEIAPELEYVTYSCPSCTGVDSGKNDEVECTLCGDTDEVLAYTCYMCFSVYTDEEAENLWYGYYECTDNHCWGHFYGTEAQMNEWMESSNRSYFLVQ